MHDAAQIVSLGRTAARQLERRQNLQRAVRFTVGHQQPRVHQLEPIILGIERAGLVKLNRGCFQPTGRKLVRRQPGLHPSPRRLPALQRRLARFLLRGRRTPADQHPTGQAQRQRDPHHSASSTAGPGSGSPRINFS